MVGWLIEGLNAWLIGWFIESWCYPEVDLLKATSTGMPTVCFSGGRKFIVNQILAEKGTLTTEKIWVQCVLRILDENLSSHFLEEETPSGNHHFTGSMSKKTRCMFNRCFFTLKIKKSPHTKTGVFLHYIRWTRPTEAIACARYLSISVLLRMFDPKELQLNHWPGVRKRAEVSVTVIQGNTYQL